MDAEFEAELSGLPNTRMLNDPLPNTSQVPEASKPTGYGTDQVALAQSQTITGATKEFHKLTAIDEAKQVIYGDREKTYGDPGKNLRVIADYWSTHLSATTGQKVRLTPNDVCVMMVLLKQARQANTPGHRDSIVDTIGYAALQDRINSVVPAATETK